GNRLVAQPRRARFTNGSRDSRRSPSEPDADQSARPVGQAQAAGKVAARSRRSTRCRLSARYCCDCLRGGVAAAGRGGAAVAGRGGAAAAGAAGGGGAAELLLPPKRKRCGLCARSVIARPALSICRVAVAVILLTPIVISSGRLSRLSMSVRAEAVASLALLIVALASLTIESTLSALRASEALNVAISLMA